MMIMSHYGISDVINVRLYDSQGELKTGASKKTCPDTSQQAPDVYVTSGWRWTWRQTDVGFWLKMKIGLTSIFDVNLTLA